MKNSKDQKILGVTIDNKSYIKELHKKASQKIGALSKLLSNYPNDSEKKIGFNSVVKSQFSYCPLLGVLFQNLQHHDKQST